MDLCECGHKKRSHKKVRQSFGFGGATQVDRGAETLWKKCRYCPCEEFSPVTSHEKRTGTGNRGGQKT